MINIDKAKGVFKKKNLTDDEFVDWFIKNAERSTKGGYKERPYTGQHYRKGWVFNNSQTIKENYFARV